MAGSPSETSPSGTVAERVQARARRERLQVPAVCPRNTATSGATGTSVRRPAQRAVDDAAAVGALGGDRSQPRAPRGRCPSPRRAATAATRRRASGLWEQRVVEVEQNAAPVGTIP